ncbi:MAG: anthranilate synthase component I family protein, partial [Candidatus Aminicenantes bacterium]|nr:anthranilate synthase component I family protein [Candidatus Aminicenantes bacterium]
APLVAEGKEKNVFDILGRLMKKYRLPTGFGSEISPFVGGGIGYFSYELGRQIEALPATTRDVMGIPECYIGFYNAVIICDHEKEKTYLSYFDPGCECSIASFERLKEEILSIRPGLYAGRGISPGWKATRGGELSSLFKSDLTKQEYMAAVNRIKEYILAGDVYQVNMTRRFETGMEGIPPWQLYKRLTHINPAPFAAYMNFAGVTVVSSSPERFLEINGRYIEAGACPQPMNVGETISSREKNPRKKTRFFPISTIEARPIKGTVKRGSTPQEDEKNKQFLLNDEKNRAELAMIVDLMRNDLGRVCETGSIEVKAFPELETYASVHHLVSTITGRLQEGKNVIDVLKAAFPGGSITGAPKIRAMEIIDELEPVERGIYTGSIGYLGFNGCSDLNIVIRTIVISGGKAHIQAGGGIVADSVDREEYEESLLKAQKLFKAFADPTT